MAHFKCQACAARVWRDGHPADGGRDLCPGCGGPLEAVERAEQLVGLHALSTRPRDGGSLGDQVREAIARNDAARVKRLQRIDERPRDT
jgi:hypothetical protein